jgi:hypothetical protein
MFTGQVKDPDGDRESGYNNPDNVKVNPADGYGIRLDDTICPLDFAVNGQITSDTVRHTEPMLVESRKD